MVCSYFLQHIFLSTFFDNIDISPLCDIKFYYLNTSAGTRCPSVNPGLASGVSCWTELARVDSRWAIIEWSTNILHLKRLIWYKVFKFCYQYIPRKYLFIFIVKVTTTSWLSIIFFSCHVWEGKEENAYKHVIFNSSWSILVPSSTRDQMNSR